MRDRWKARLPTLRSTSFHRRASNSPRRAPVVAARRKKSPRDGFTFDAWATSTATSAALGGRISAGTERGGLAWLAGFSQIHSQRSAWASARCKTTWTRRTVPAASGRLMATASAEVGVEAIDVRRGELGDRQVAEMPLEVVLDEALSLSPRARRPTARCRLEPAIEQVGNGAVVDPGEGGFVCEPIELSAGGSLASPDGSGRPALTAALRVHSHVDAQLPAVRPSSADRSSHGRRL